MYNADTELLYPMRVTPYLKNVRDEKWAALVEHILAKETKTSEKLGFSLMMIKMDGCINCNTDSFRAMRGCTQCAKQNVKRFRGNDDELYEQYEHAVLEIEHYLENRPI